MSFSLPPAAFKIFSLSLVCSSFALNMPKCDTVFVFILICLGLLVDAPTTLEKLPSIMSLNIYSTSFYLPSPSETSVTCNLDHFILSYRSCTLSLFFFSVWIISVQGTVRSPGQNSGPDWQWQGWQQQQKAAGTMPAGERRGSAWGQHGLEVGGRNVYPSADPLGDICTDTHSLA